MSDNEWQKTVLISFLVGFLSIVATVYTVATFISGLS